MKMLHVKFQHNRTIYEKFNFFRENVGGVRSPHIKILISIIISEHMKIFRFKFQQNGTINEEFDFWRGLRGRGV